MPAVNTQIANVTSPAQRATAWALAVFVLHLLGDTAAPPLFGEVEEYLTGQRVVEQLSSQQGLTSGQAVGELARRATEVVGLSFGCQGNMPGVIDVSRRVAELAKLHALAEQHAREQAFQLFSFSLLLAGFCCLVAAYTAKSDTERVARKIERRAIV
jgi:hypothetical protein